MELSCCSSRSQSSPSPFDSLPVIEEVQHLPEPIRRGLIRTALLAIRQYLASTSDRLRRHGDPCSACIDEFERAIGAADDFTKKLDDMIEAQRLASRPRRPREEEEEQGESKRHRVEFRFSSTCATGGVMSF